ncbi:MAG: hypothetical protein IJG88_05660 [Eggerthellaceae bacterium]|nr:hypothetical protein [Eggerthellaceae bacterium]
MPTDEEILSEGRLTEEQDLVLYNLALRQDEYGRQATNMLLSKIETDEGYQAMLARELITLKVNKYGNAGAPTVAQVIVTSKGLRYCVLHSEEIEPLRPHDVAGRLRKTATW